MTGRERVSASLSKGLGRIRLCRPEQDVALLAERQFDHALWREIAGPQDHLLVCNSDIVDAQPAALDLSARLAVRRDKSGPDEQRRHADAGFEFSAGNFYGGKIFGDRAFLKSLPGGFRRGSVCSSTWQWGGVTIGKRLLGFVVLRALQGRQSYDLVQRQRGEQF